MESGNRRGELKKVLQGGAQKTADVRAREKQEDTTLRVEDEKWPIIEPAWTPGKQKVRTGKPSWRLIAGMLGAVCVLLAVCVGLYLWGRSPMSPLSENIVIATDASWPPMEMVDENKNIVGFDIDLMKAAAKASGFTVEFKNIAWEDIFAGLENNNYDAVMSSVIITDERKKTMDFSIPYINAGQILIVKRETTGVVKLSDLEGKTAGAQKGTTGAFEIEKNKTIKEKTYEEIGLAIEDLANSQVDGVVCDTPTAVQFVLRNPNYNGKLKIVGEPLTEEYCGVAVKRGNRKVLDKINSGLHKVLDSGESKQIRERWLQ
jgi:polar amino acid transport system substrate-binding protein